MTTHAIGKCARVATVHYPPPPARTLKRVLTDNRFSGEHGVSLLEENYGAAFQPTSTSTVFTAYIGMYDGHCGQLLSATGLWLYHFMRRIPLDAGFFAREEMVEYARYKMLLELLESGFDVVGCIGWSGGEKCLEAETRRPPTSYWLGISSKGWLAIDPSYWLATLFESLFDLLRWENGREIVVEEDE